MRRKKKERGSKPLWLLLLANYLLLPVIAITYGHPKENYNDITSDHDESVSTSCLASATLTFAFSTPSATTVSALNEPVFTYFAAGSSAFVPPATTTASYYAFVTATLTTPTPPNQHVVRLVTDVEHDIGDHPPAYDNPERLLTELPSLEVIHQAADVPQDTNDPSGMRDDIKQYPVDTQQSEIIREEPDVPVDLINPSPINDDHEQPFIDSRDRRSARVVSDPADAFIDIPSHSTTHDNDSSNTNAFTTTTDHQVGADSATESSDSERKNGLVSGKMDDAEKRRRIVLSSTSNPVFNKVITVGRLALDFGVNWLPQNWNPHDDPPVVDHIVEKWAEKLAVQDRQNAEGDAINHVLRGKLQQVDVTLDVLKRKVKVFQMAETRHEERNDRANERDTAADARDLEIGEKQRAAEALMKEANEKDRRVRKRFLHKTMRDLARDHRFDTTDPRSTAVSIPQSPPFWRILPPQPYCPVPRSSLTTQAVRAAWRYLQQTIAWFKSVDWQTVGKDIRQGMLIAGQNLSSCSTICVGCSHEGQFRPPRTRFIENELRRRGRYGLADRSPPPEYLGLIASRPVTSTQLITERASGPDAAGFVSVLDERWGRLVERASSLRRSRSLSPRMIPSRNEDVVRPVRQIETPSRSVLVGPAAEPEPSQPQQPLVDTAPTPDLVNDAAASLLQLEFVGSSVFNTPSPPGHFQAGDAVSSDAPAEVVPQTVTEDEETVLPLPHDVSVSTVSEDTDPIEVDAPAPDIATENVEMVLAPEPDASVGATVTNSVSDYTLVPQEGVLNNAQAPQEEVPDEAQVPREEEQEVPVPVPQEPSPRTVDAPQPSRTDDDERTMVEPATPSTQLGFSARRVSFSPHVSIKVIPRKDEEEKPVSVEQTATLPVPVDVESIAVVPNAPACPVRPASTVTLATPMDVEEAKEAGLQPEPSPPIRAPSPVFLAVEMETEPTFMNAVGSSSFDCVDVEAAPSTTLSSLPVQVSNAPTELENDDMETENVKEENEDEMMQSDNVMEEMEDVRMDGVERKTEDVEMERKDLQVHERVGIEDMETEVEDVNVQHLHLLALGAETQVEAIQTPVQPAPSGIASVPDEPMYQVPGIFASLPPVNNAPVFILPALPPLRSTWPPNVAVSPTPCIPASTNGKNLDCFDFSLPAFAPLQSTWAANGPASSTPRLPTSSRELDLDFFTFKAPALAKPNKNPKPRRPNKIKRQPPSRLSIPSRPVVDPAVPQDSATQATGQLLELDELTPPWEIDRAHAKVLYEGIKREHAETAVPVVIVDIPTEPSSTSSNQVNSTGRTAHVYRGQAAEAQRSRLVQPAIRKPWRLEGPLEPMTFSYTVRKEDMLASVAAWQAEELAKRQVHSLPTGQRRFTSQTRSSHVTTQPDLEALPRSSPSLIPATPITDTVYLRSNTNEIPVVNDDDGPVHGHAPPFDLDALMKENAVNETTKDGVERMPHQTDNVAEGEPDPVWAPVSDVDVYDFHDDEHVWSLEDDSRMY
ncbi:hypothetical protein QFC21_006976 [Naganishia friedmannii]|uniref:Uncharacterized protein n=1 Tax=Naganishia friedmannii TaxID=89922 RepID=A0ACC2UYF4_9TREE|nr:hypothetical protein QFC21_006976 [Naganishia friedmannii]